MVGGRETLNDREGSAVVEGIDRHQVLGDEVGRRTHTVGGGETLKHLAGDGGVPIRLRRGRKERA